MLTFALDPPICAATVWYSTIVNVTRIRLFGACQAAAPAAVNRRAGRVEAGMPGLLGGLRG
jgi:hypothetical protein